MQLIHSNKMLLQLLLLSLAMLLFPISVCGGALNLSNINTNTSSYLATSTSLLSAFSTQVATTVNTTFSKALQLTSNNAHATPTTLSASSAQLTSATRTATSSALADKPPIDLSATQDLEERGFSENLLLHYDIRCEAGANVGFPVDWSGRTGRKYKPNTFLTACKSFWVCDSAGNLIPASFDRKFVPGSQAYLQKTYCQQKCSCIAIDLPQEHYFANFGCANPYGAWVFGAVADVSKRSEGEVFPIGGGLNMQAYHGPAREE